MKVFKLRIESDESSNFILEVEIKASQTFMQLHDFLIKTLNLKGDELASFFITDEKWQKSEEITLLDMSGDEDEHVDDEDETHTIYLMSKIRLDEFIDKESQYLLYEYDFLQMHTFYIEVIGISSSEKGITYPRLTHQQGQLKLETKVKVEKDPDKLRESLLNEFNLMMKDDMDDDDDDISDDDY